MAACSRVAGVRSCWLCASFGLALGRENPPYTKVVWKYGIASSDDCFRVSH